MNETEIIKAITECEQRGKSNSKRLDDVEKHIENMNDLIGAVHDMATEVRYMRQDIDKLNTKVEVIENKPIKRWETVVTTAITVVISAVVGFILAGGIIG